MKHFGFMREWVKLWIRREVQLDDVMSAHPIVEMKCVRQHFEEALAASGILILIIE